jgi:hypothetical protein
MSYLTGEQNASHFIAGRSARILRDVPEVPPGTSEEAPQNAELSAQDVRATSRLDGARRSRACRVHLHTTAVRPRRRRADRWYRGADPQ